MHIFGNIFIKLPLPRISQRKINASDNSELLVSLWEVCFKAWKGSIQDMCKAPFISES